MGENGQLPGGRGPLGKGVLRPPQGWMRNRHGVGKAGAVNRNEGLHSRLRKRINRLRRKTKGYSNRAAMLSGHIALVCLKLSLIQCQHPWGIPACRELAEGVR